MQKGTFHRRQLQKPHSPHEEELQRGENAAPAPSPAASPPEPANPVEGSTPTVPPVEPPPKE